MQVARALRMIVVLAICAIAAPAQADTELETLAAKGRQYLSEQQFSQALRHFRAGQRQARDDDAWRGRFLFYEAVTLQQQAQSEGNRIDLLRNAARLYESYLKTNPKSAAGYNNLAQVQELLGDRKQAEKSYGSAVAVSVGDKRRALYLQNLAEFAANSGDETKAQKIRESLALANPGDISRHERIIQQYIEYDDEAALVLYLWRTLEAGQPHRAVTSSLDTLLEQRNGLTRSTKESLISLVCVGLSRNFVAPQMFRRSPVAGQLADLGGDEHIGDGVVQLSRLYRGAETLDLRPDDLSWWRTRGSARRDPEVGAWPVDGIREFIRAIGNWHKLNGEFETSERYIRLAIDLHPEETDPAAFRDLVNLFVRENKIEKAQALYDEYERRLYRSKGEAYRNSNYEKIFEFHRTLGELYTFLGQWGDESQVTSAIFQLEHARTISLRIEDERKGQLNERFRFTPTMTNALANAYTNTGNAAASYKVRLDQAKYYEQKTDINDARLVLKPIDNKPPPPTVDPGTLRNYEILMRDTVPLDKRLGPEQLIIRDAEVLKDATEKR